MAIQPRNMMNRHQRRARKPGERRVRGAEIWRLVELSRSKDPNDRLEAADNLCPCHVRRRIEEVWDALYRLLEDQDVRVRKAAYHTLVDGGDMSDPALIPIFERARKNETDVKIRRRVEKFLRNREDRARKRAEFLQDAQMIVGEYPERGRCDFCGEVGRVKKDYDTSIPGARESRAALICKACDR